MDIKFLSFRSINFHIHPLISLPLYSYVSETHKGLNNPLWVSVYIFIVFLNFASTSFYDSSDKPIPLINLQENGHGSSSVKQRNKRSYDHGHSKDLALELAKNYVSSSILNKWDENTTLSTTLST